MRLSTTENQTAWLVCLLSALISSAVASPDSPFTHSELCHIDSAWFLDGGRWLMQGLVPYVDFTDSKGPLLWLWYGLGYLMDPTGWRGMFWLFTLNMAVACRVIWAVSRLMFQSDRAAAFIAIAMPVVYLYFSHPENRAEDLAQIPLAFMIYLAVRALSGRRISRELFILEGVALGAMMFVKWSFPIMMLPLPIIAAVFDARHKAPSPRDEISFWTIFLRNIGLGLTGMLAICAVIALWMWSIGALKPMIEEYFINTALTIENDEGFHTSKLIQTISILLPHRKRAIFYLLCITFVSVRLYGRKGLWLAFAFLYMMFLCFIHNMGYTDQIYDTFGLYAPAAAVLLLQKRWPVRTRMIAAESLCVIVMLYVSASRNHENFGETPPLASFREMADRVDSIDNPRILYYDTPDYALGIKSGGLPPSSNWASQSGATADMVRDQIEVMRTGRADVVVTDRYETLPAHFGYLTDPQRDIFPCPYPSAGNFRVWWHPRHRRMTADTPNNIGCDANYFWGSGSMTVMPKAPGVSLRSTLSGRLWRM